MTNFLIKILIMLNYQRIGIQVGKPQLRILKNWLKRVKQVNHSNDYTRLS